MRNCGRHLLFVVIAGCAILAACGSSGSNQAKSAGETGATSIHSVAQVTPAYLAFGNQAVNSTSSPAAIMLTNTGNATLSLSSIRISGSFAQTNNCGTTVAASATCTVEVVYKPTAPGNHSGALSFADNAALSPQVVTLNGTGVVAGQLADSPASISFGNVALAQSISRTVTISNVGGQNVTINSVGTSGAGIGATGISTPLTLSPNQSTTFAVTFNPTSAGAVSGSVYLVNDGASPSFDIPVTGTGLALATHEVILTWNGSVSPVVGYNVYRATATGGPYAKVSSAVISQTSYTDFGVVAGKSYFYVVTAVSSGDQESSYSVEAKATVPTP